MNLGTKTANGATHFDCTNSGGGTDIVLEGVSWARYRTFGAVIRRSTNIYAWIVEGEPTIEDPGAFTLKIEGTENGTPIEVSLVSVKIRHTGTARGRVLDNRAILRLYETVISGGNVQGNSGEAGDGGGILNRGELEVKKSIRDHRQPRQPRRRHSLQLHRQRRGCVRIDRRQQQRQPA